MTAVKKKKKPRGRPMPLVDTERKRWTREAVARFRAKGGTGQFELTIPKVGQQKSMKAFVELLEKCGKSGGQIYVILKRALDHAPDIPETYTVIMKHSMFGVNVIEEVSFPRRKKDWLDYAKGLVKSQLAYKAGRKRYGVSPTKEMERIAKAIVSLRLEDETAVKKKKKPTPIRPKGLMDDILKTIWKQQEKEEAWLKDLETTKPLNLFDALPPSIQKGFKVMERTKPKILTAVERFERATPHISLQQLAEKWHFHKLGIKWKPWDEALKED